MLTAALLWTSGEVDASLFQPAAQRPFLPQFEFIPPPSLGRIADYYNAPSSSKDLVILIQDLHAHYGVQRHIAGILEFLSDKLRNGEPKNRGIGEKILNAVAPAPRVSGTPIPFALAVEGAQGPIDSSIMAFFPDARIKEATCDYLMREGEMTGMEYFAVMHSQPYLLTGVENEKYYEIHRDLFRKTLPSRQALVKILNGVQLEVESLQPIVYHSALKNMDDKKEAFEKGVLSTDEYIAFLADTARAAGVDARDKYPSFYAFVSALRQSDRKNGLARLLAGRTSATPDPSLLRGQISELLKETYGYITDEERKNLTMLARQSDPSSYYMYLRDVVYNHQLFSAVPPELARYMEYLHTSQSVGMDRLLHEANELSFLIKLRLARTPAEKDLAQVEHDLNLLIRITDLTATEMEVKTFGPRFDQFIALCKSVIGSKGLVAFNEDKIRRLVSTSIDYYVMALLRNKPMVENTLALLSHAPASSLEEEVTLADLKDKPASANDASRNALLVSNEQRAMSNEETPNDVNAVNHNSSLITHRSDTVVLVAGGFHTDSLTRMLRDKGVSYVVITPTVDKLTPADHELYIKRLSGTLLSTEEILQAAYSTAPTLARAISSKETSSLATGIYGPALAGSFILFAGAFALAHGISFHGLEHMVTAGYAGANLHAVQSALAQLSAAVSQQSHLTTSAGAVTAATSLMAASVLSQQPAKQPSNNLSFSPKEIATAVIIGGAGLGILAYLLLNFPFAAGIPLLIGVTILGRKLIANVSQQGGSTIKITNISRQVFTYIGLAIMLGVGWVHNQNLLRTSPPSAPQTVHVSITVREKQLAKAEDALRKYVDGYLRKFIDPNIKAMPWGNGLRDIGMDKEADPYQDMAQRRLDHFSNFLNKKWNALKGNLPDYIKNKPNESVQKMLFVLKTFAPDSYYLLETADIHIRIAHIGPEGETLGNHTKGWTGKPFILVNEGLGNNPFLSAAVLAHEEVHTGQTPRTKLELPAALLGSAVDSVRSLVPPSQLPTVEIPAFREGNSFLKKFKIDIDDRAAGEAYTGERFANGVPGIILLIFTGAGFFALSGPLFKDRRNTPQGMTAPVTPPSYDSTAYYNRAARAARRGGQLRGGNGPGAQRPPEQRRLRSENEGKSLPRRLLEFIGVVTHEVGHYLLARAFGLRVTSFNIWSDPGVTVAFPTQESNKSVQAVRSTALAGDLFNRLGLMMGGFGFIAAAFGIAATLALRHALGSGIIALAVISALIALSNYSVLRGNRNSRDKTIARQAAEGTLPNNPILFPTTEQGTVGPEEPGHASGAVTPEPAEEEPLTMGEELSAPAHTTPVTAPVTHTRPAAKASRVLFGMFSVSAGFTAAMAAAPNLGSLIHHDLTSLLAVGAIVVVGGFIMRKITKSIGNPYIKTFLWTAFVVVAGIALFMAFPHLASHAGLSAAQQAAQAAAAAGPHAASAVPHAAASSVSQAMPSLTVSDNNALANFTIAHNAIQHINPSAQVRGEYIVQVSQNILDQHPIAEISRHLVHISYTTDQLNGLVHDYLHGDWGQLAKLLDNPQADPGAGYRVAGVLYQHGNQLVANLHPTIVQHINNPSLVQAAAGRASAAVTQAGVSLGATPGAFHGKTLDVLSGANPGAWSGSPPIHWTDPLGLNTGAAYPASGNVAATAQNVANAGTAAKGGALGVAAANTFTYVKNNPLPTLVESVLSLLVLISFWRARRSRAGTGTTQNAAPPLTDNQIRVVAETVVTKLQEGGFTADQIREYLDLPRNEELPDYLYDLDDLYYSITGNYPDADRERIDNEIRTLLASPAAPVAAPVAAPAPAATPSQGSQLVGVQISIPLTAFGIMKGAQQDFFDGLSQKKNELYVQYRQKGGEEWIRENMLTWNIDGTDMRQGETHIFFVKPGVVYEFQVCARNAQNGGLSQTPVATIKTGTPGNEQIIRRSPVTRGTIGEFTVPESAPAAPASSFNVFWHIFSSLFGEIWQDAIDARNLPAGERTSLGDVMAGLGPLSENLKTTNIQVEMVDDLPWYKAGEFVPGTGTPENPHKIRLNSRYSAKALHRALGHELIHAAQEMVDPQVNRGFWSELVTIIREDKNRVQSILGWMLLIGVALAAVAAVLLGIGTGAAVGTAVPAAVMLLTVASAAHAINSANRAYTDAASEAAAMNDPTLNGLIPANNRQTVTIRSLIDATRASILQSA